MRIYIAGPMSGKPNWNFDAFDQAVEDWKAAGHTPISPADIDRIFGFDPEKSDPEEPVSRTFKERVLVRDIHALLDCDAIALLPGWEHSKGVAFELAVAQFLGLQIFDAITQSPLSVQRKYAFEPRPICDYECCTLDYSCRESCPDQLYLCTRNKGHIGDHMACGLTDDQHPIKTWTQS